MFSFFNLCLIDFFKDFASPNQWPAVCPRFYYAVQAAGHESIVRARRYDIQCLARAADAHNRRIACQLRRMVESCRSTSL